MSGHPLDLVITREVDYLLSDHITVICDLLIKKPSFTVKEISYRKIDGIDIESFSPSVRSSALIQDSPGNLEDLVNLYNTTLSKILDRQSNGSFKSSIYTPFTRVERTDLRSNRRKRSFHWNSTMRCLLLSVWYLCDTSTHRGTKGIGDWKPPECETLKRSTRHWIKFEEPAKLPEQTWLLDLWNAFY